MKTIIIKDQYEEEVMSYLHECGIPYKTDPYEAMLSINIDMYLSNIMSQDNWVDQDIQEDVRSLTEEELDEIKDTVLESLMDNEYISQTINECTEDAISIESSNIVKRRIFAKVD